MRKSFLSMLSKRRIVYSVCFTLSDFLLFSVIIFGILPSSTYSLLFLHPSLPYGHSPFLPILRLSHIVSSQFPFIRCFFLLLLFPRIPLLPAFFLYPLPPLFSLCILFLLEHVTLYALFLCSFIVSSAHILNFPLFHL